MLPRVIFQRVVSSLGLINNAILILLVWKKSPKKLGNYKILMVYIAIFEIFYALLDLMATPEVYSNKSAFFIIVSITSTFVPEFVANCAIVSFCSLFGMSLAIFAIHFVYRYLVMEKSKFILQNQVKKILALIIFTLLIGCIWMTSTLLFCSPNIYADEFLTREYLPRINFNSNSNLMDIKYMGSLFWFPDGIGGFYYNWRSVCSLSLMIILINLSSLTVFYCGYGIYKKIKTLSSVKSSATSSLQSQLFWALVFQTTIPVVLMHIPAGTGFCLSIFDSSFDLIGEISTITIFLYPALDPLPNFFIIKDYRNAILEFQSFFDARNQKIVRNKWLLHNLAILHDIILFLLEVVSEESKSDVSMSLDVSNMNIARPTKNKRSNQKNLVKARKARAANLAVQENSVRRRAKTVEGLERLPLQLDRQMTIHHGEVFQLNPGLLNETYVILKKTLQIAMIYGIGVEEDKKTKIETGFIIPIICTLSFNPEQEFKALGHISKSMKDDAETAYYAVRHEMDQVERTIKYLVTLEYRHRSSLNGPSGQLATALCVFFAYKGEQIPSCVAVTGTVSSSGRVGSIGGLLCKVRKCVELYKYVIVPEAQLNDIPQRLKDKIKILPVAELSGARSIKKKTIKENPIS